MLGVSQRNSVLGSLGACDANDDVGKIKTDRVAYCESFVEDDGCSSDLLDVVMLDGKNFFLTRVATGYIVVSGEVRFVVVKLLQN